MEKILIIQTAFIGDVVLATALVEKMHDYYPNSKIDFLLRKGNQGLLDHHPFLNEVLIWDKKNQKTKNLFQLLKQIRSTRYDLVINVHRFFSTSFLTVFSKAKTTVGFSKSPLSFLFKKTVAHQFGIEGIELHEVERNQKLIESYTDNKFAKPRLYPTSENYNKVKTNQTYACLAPSSVWFTKQLPQSKWIELINKLNDVEVIYLLGGPGDKEACDTIAKASIHSNIKNMAGQLSFLDSVALMKNAKMNYVNDSAPLHFASAVNAPVTAFFCSTIPGFGFTPLSDVSIVLETKESLDCRPCGMHGKKACPLGHFKCGDISVA